MEPTDGVTSGHRRDQLRIAAAASLLAAAIGGLQVAVEVYGVGVAGIPVPSSVEEWFGLLHDNQLLGLTELTALQIPLFALAIPVFLGLRVALRQVSEPWATVATALGLIGIAVYLSSNTALSMLTLADRYAGATGDVERMTLLAAGESMLAIYDGPGIGAGVSLVMAATLILSALMVRSPIFGLPTAATGITAGVLGLAYFAATALPATRIFVLEGAGATFLVWLALVGIHVGRYDPSGAA